MSAVLCNRCGKQYDLTKVKVTARYADCSMYITPCCNKQVDDREWVSSPAFRRITPFPCVGNRGFLK